MANTTRTRRIESLWNAREARETSPEYNAGFEAFGNGLERSACPAEYTHEQRMLWLAGWVDHPRD